jgi:hypothetical protein
VSRRAGGRRAHGTPHATCAPPVRNLPAMLRPDRRPPRPVVASRSPAAARAFLPVLAVLGACRSAPHGGDGTFASDLAFLQRHVETIVLTSPTGARVAVVPAYQGRVMTSTAGGRDGASFGWIHRERIASDRVEPHINVFGGEDRFWIGPEGGQFSVFFAPGSEFTLAQWQTPAPIDTEPYDVLERTASRVVFGKGFSLTNRAGTRFHVDVRREVAMLDPADVLAGLGVALEADTRAVSFASANTLTNAGAEPWRKETGLLSIWILGMFVASPHSHVLVPFVGGPARYHGPIVNDDYFGKVPPERLRIDHERSLLVFRADAQQRGKIGVGPKRAKPVMGSWDDARGVLTLVEFTLPVDAHEYVDSTWRLQQDPYGGDVVNSYNDGPAQPGGKGMGAFYELESSSPALALAPGAHATHVHRTTHLVGPRPTLAAIAAHVLGADLDALPRAR